MYVDSERATKEVVVAIFRLPFRHVWNVWKCTEKLCLANAAVIQTEYFVCPSRSITIPTCSNNRGISLKSYKTS
jgi:hypothetical protein